MTSSLTEVSGGSIGFAIEASWFGFTDEYVYSGSSSPQTGWLPSYTMNQGLEFKYGLNRLAVKTVAAELEVAQDLGYECVTRYVIGESLPSKVAVESSAWFFEMLLCEKGPSQ